MYLRVLFFDCLQIAAMLIGTLGKQQRCVVKGYMYMYVGKLGSAYHAYYLLQLVVLMNHLLFDI